MKVLFDTNVILDHMLDRPPFRKAATELFINIERGTLSGYLGATSITTIYYLAAKVNGKKHAESSVVHLLRLFDVIPISRTVLEGALLTKFSDFEDAVLHEASLQAGVQAIVTRNNKDFQHSTIAVHSPNELVKILHMMEISRKN